MTPLVAFTPKMVTLPGVSRSLIHVAMQRSVIQLSFICASQAQMLIILCFRNGAEIDA